MKRMPKETGVTFRIGLHESLTFGLVVVAWRCLMDVILMGRAGFQLFLGILVLESISVGQALVADRGPVSIQSSWVVEDCLLLGDVGDDHSEPDYFYSTESMLDVIAKERTPAFLTRLSGGTLEPKWAVKSSLRYGSMGRDLSLIVDQNGDQSVDLVTLASVRKSEKGLDAGSYVLVVSGKDGALIQSIRVDGGSGSPDSPPSGSRFRLVFPADGGIPSSTVIQASGAGATYVGRVTPNSESIEWKRLSHSRDLEIGRLYQSEREESSGRYGSLVSWGKYMDLEAGQTDTLMATWEIGRFDVANCEAIHSTDRIDLASARVREDELGVYGVAEISTADSSSEAGAAIPKWFACGFFWKVVSIAGRSGEDRPAVERLRYDRIQFPMRVDDDMHRPRAFSCLRVQGGWLFVGTRMDVFSPTVYRTQILDGKHSNLSPVDMTNYGVEGGTGWALELFNVGDGVKLLLTSDATVDSPPAIFEIDAIEGRKSAMTTVREVVAVMKELL